MDANSIDQVSRSSISIRQATWVWCRVALLSFGGPAGQIAVMHRILVEEKRWISEERFLHALNFCMLLPGPEAQQLATYIGWILHRTRGGLIAGILFIVPGFLSILALSIMYATYQESFWIEALFYGLKPAVIAIVLEAVVRIGRRVLRQRTAYAIAAASFIAIFLFQVPFPVLIVIAAAIGIVQVFISQHNFQNAPATRDSQTSSFRYSILSSLRVIIACLLIWYVPLAVLARTLGPLHTLVIEGTFFSKVAVVTFGGAYSVLAYVAQQAVEVYGWLQPGEMLDGLSMAETTPGPLIMVVQHVGFMGAYRNPGPLEPLWAGILGAVVTTWVTFVPCFLWIFLGAPYVERLQHNRWIAVALQSISACVVGVILNLAVWFAVHTWFAEVTPREFLGGSVSLPVLASIDPASVAISVAACFITFYWRRGIGLTLAICCMLGIGVAIARSQY